MSKGWLQTSNRETTTAGRVFEDGTIAELIFEPKSRSTAFAIWRDGNLTVEAHIKFDDEILVPISAENNLIKHQAVLLPSYAASYQSEKTLRASMQEFIHRYADLTPLFERIAVEYVLLTWVYDAFNELPYLRLQGDYGSGKTRLLLTLGSLAYRPFFASGASTVSPIFHTLNAFRGTLVFDEADFRLSDEKADLVKILNNGNVRGIPVLRTMMSPKREFNPAAFQVFGPKIVATRGTYDDKALESRFITELMGGRRLREDIPINLPPTFKDEALDIRNQLLMYRFRNHGKMYLDPSLADPTLEPRQNQVLGPLLSIVDDESLRAEIRRSAREVGQTLVAERGLSIEGELLNTVLDLLNTHSDGSIPIKLVQEAFVASYGDEYERPITNRYLAAILKRKLAIRLMKTMGVTAIPRTEEPRIREIAKRFGLDNMTAPMSREEGR